MGPIKDDGGDYVQQGSRMTPTEQSMSQQQTHYKKRKERDSRKRKMKTASLIDTQSNTVTITDEK